MPDLAAFARRIRRRAQQVEKGVDRIVVQTALAVSQAVVLATPVDTGRARANWQVGVGFSPRGVLEDKDKSGASTVSRNSFAIRSRRGDQDIFISNNVDYITALNEGSSSQAPAGFVEEAVNAGARAVQRGQVIRD